MVILEPDGLGIIPWYRQFQNTAAQAAGYEWCRPEEAQEETAAAERFAMLTYAVESLKAGPNTSVYLDGTHSAWLSVPDAAHRLLQAGVAGANGFFLNVSNYQRTADLIASYQRTADLIAYGNAISDCIALVRQGGMDVTKCPGRQGRLRRRRGDRRPGH